MLVVARKLRADSTCGYSSLLRLFAEVNRAVPPQPHLYFYQKIHALRRLLSGWLSMSNDSQRFAYILEDFITKRIVWLQGEMSAKQEKDKRNSKSERKMDVSDEAKTKDKERKTSSLMVPLVLHGCMR